MAGRKTETDAITHRGRELPFVVVRSAQRQKSISVGVQPGGEVRVLAPTWVAKNEIRRIVGERADWLFERLDAEPPPARPHLDDGATLLLYGNEVRLRVERTQRVTATAREVEGAILVSIPAGFEPERDDLAIRQALRLFFQRKTLALVERYVFSLAPVVGKNPGRIFVREQKTRWGSCGRDGSMRFNWRLAMLPPGEVEYVVAHELCHLVHLNHSAAFWAEVARVLPGRGAGPKRVRVTIGELPL